MKNAAEYLEFFRSLVVVELIDSQIPNTKKEKSNIYIIPNNTSSLNINFITIFC